jgi:hypothetical protein
MGLERMTMGPACVLYQNTLRVIEVILVGIASVIVDVLAAISVVVTSTNVLL